MQQTILLIIGTAVVTALITLAAVYLLYLYRIRPELERQMKAAGDTMEERVRQGVLSAGEELLPKFREKVTEGFSRALADWPSSEVTRFARTGANLVGEGLNTLLGGKKRE